MFALNTRRNKPSRIEPTPQYPHIVLALNFIESKPSQFHWHLFIPDPDQDNMNAQRSGTKVHAVLHPIFGKVASSWSFEAVPYSLAASQSVAAVAIIGQLKDKTMEQLVDLLKQIPMDIPDVDRQREPDFSCRTWMREALRRLHGAGFIHCPDVDALEEEMQDYCAASAEPVKSNMMFLHCGTSPMARLRFCTPQLPLYSVANWRKVVHQVQVADDHEVRRVEKTPGMTSCPISGLAYGPSGTEGLWCFDAMPITLATDKGGPAARHRHNQPSRRQGRFRVGRQRLE